MGAWGPGLYQNDVSDDVKSIFRDQLHRGKNTEQITRELMESFRHEITDIDDRPNFWLALADTQWDMGRLLPEVKAQAQACLSDGSAFLLWEKASRREITKRKQVLEKLAEKLNTPQPPEKKVSQYRLYQCPWKEGDVFALPLVSDQAKKLGMTGGWILLEKAGEMIWHPGHRIPVMYAKLHSGSDFPSTTEEFERLEYIKRRSVWIDMRMHHIPDPSDQSKYANMIRSLDENGYLTEYRFGVITTSQRSIPKNLIYIGNFSGAKHPEKEYIREFEVEISVSFWKELEEKMLECYSRKW